MAGRQSILENFRWLAASNFIVKPLWFLFVLLSTRFLGPAEFGRFMFALSFIAVVSYMFEGGIDMFAMRELSRNPERFRALVPRTLFLKCLSGVLVGGVAMLIAFGMGIATETRILIALASLHGLLNSLLVHSRFVFRAFEIMKFEAYSIVIEKAAIVVLCGASFVISQTAGVFMIAFVLAYLMATSTTLAMVRAHIGSAWAEISFRTLWGDILRPALPFALMGIFMVVYFRAGTLMIQWLTGDETSVGFFSAGYRLVEAFALLPSIVVMPLYATFSREKDDKPLVGGLVFRAARGLVALSLLVSVPFVVFHRDVTGLLFGDAFLPASQTIGLTVLTMVPVGLTWLFVNLAGAVGRQSTLNRFIIGITLTNIVLNYVLVGSFGALGAAITTLVTEVVMALSSLWVVRDYVAFDKFAVLVAGAGAPVAVVWGISMLHLVPGPFLLQLGVALTILTVGQIVTGVVTLGEIRKILGR